MRSGNGQGIGDDGESGGWVASKDAGGEVGEELSVRIKYDGMPAAWEPVPLVYCSWINFVSDAVFHVRASFGPIIPSNVKDPLEWHSLVTFVTCEYLTRQVDYETWAIIGVTPLKMAQLVRMICAELKRT